MSATYRIQLLEKQVRQYAAQNEILRRGIELALPLVRAGHSDLAVKDLTNAIKRVK